MSYGPLVSAVPVQPSPEPEDFWHYDKFSEMFLCEMQSKSIKSQNINVNTE